MIARNPSSFRDSIPYTLCRQHTDLADMETFHQIQRNVDRMMVARRNKRSRLARLWSWLMTPIQH